MMIIRLLKVIKKYRIHFNENPTLYNDIINEFGKWYGEMDDNININTIKIIIIKSIKEMKKTI